MRMKDRLVDQAKKLTSSGVVVRVVSNDRVMRLATGVMDAKNRLRAARERAAEAWDILLNGHARPNIDPSLDDEAGVHVATPGRAPARRPAAPAPRAAPPGCRSWRRRRAAKPRASAAGWRAART